MSGELYDPSEEHGSIEHDELVEEWKSLRTQQLDKIQQIANSPRYEYPDFYVNPQCIAPEQATEIMKIYYSNGIRGEGKTGTGLVNEHTRQVETYYLEDINSHKLLTEMFEDANSQPFFNFDMDGMETPHMLVYHADDNAHYTWHIDAVNSNDYRRVLSTSLLLNSSSEYTGGELQLFMGIDQGGNPNVLDVPLEKPGDMVVFKSDMVHRVKRVTSGTRVALVTWMWGEYGNRQR